jgi:large subunit ribosomal protein L28
MPDHGVRGRPDGSPFARHTADISAAAGTLEGRLLRSWAMAAVCDICGKKPFFGMQVSHSHRRSPKRWDPNVQRVRALVNGTPKRLHVCTSCLKAGKVKRAV